MSDKVDHLNMIESVITRMASNSLQIKCWCLAIVGAAIVLSRSAIIAACILPVILFCYLDVNYISLEKSYRNLYDEVRQKDDSDIDFSMHFKPVLKTVSLRSWSVWPFYLSTIVLLIALSIVNYLW